MRFSPEHILVIGAVIAYVRAAMLASGTGADLDSNAAGRPLVPRIGLALLACALLLHALRTGDFPVYGGFEVLTLYGIAIAAGMLHLARRTRLNGIDTFLFPVLALLALVAAVLLARPTRVPDSARSPLLTLHIVAALAGYGLFTLESVLGAAYLLQDNNLKRKRFGPLFRRLPPLEALDRLMGELIGVAFLLFSLAMILGIYLAHRNNWQASWPRDPKIVASAGTWLVYAVLFHLQRPAGRHGRKVAIVAVLGFVLVLFAAIGVHLFTDSVHSFLATPPEGGRP